MEDDFMSEKKLSIRDLIMEYYKKHPKEATEHGPVVDYVEERYLELYGHKPRDTWRSIRRLHQEGILIKVKKGIYKYDPDLIDKKELFEFPPEVKEEIFKRDGYKCVVCGRGVAEGAEIHADHIRPMDKGGLNTLKNGQTLCSQHNFLKKNYSQTEFAKKFFVRIYRRAKKEKDERMMNFCTEILIIFEKYEIDSHIKSPKTK